MKTKGFTLIELMVVISIIALLSSIGFSQFAEARNRANDSKKISEIGQVEKAVVLYKDSTGRVPKNYNCDGSYCSGGGGNSVAVEGTQAYNASMQELVDAGYFPMIPKSPDNTYVFYSDATGQIASFGATLKSISSGGNTGGSCSILSSSVTYEKCVGLDGDEGVVWAGADELGKKNWANGKAACAAKAMRLPTVAEFLAQAAAGYPAGGFTQSPSAPYWTADELSSSRAYFVILWGTPPQQGIDNKTSSAERVRCVR